MKIDQNTMNSFAVCRRKAYLSKDDAGKEKGDEFGFSAEYSGMTITARADGIAEIDGESFFVLDRQSKSLKERHRTEAAYLSFVLSLLGKNTKVGVRLADGVKMLHPRMERVLPLLDEMKKIFESPVPPNPSFSYACKGCVFYKDCVSAASRTGDISMVNRIGEGRKRALIKAGFGDIDSLAGADPETIARYTGISSKEAYRIVLQAKAISSSEWMVLKRPEIPDSDFDFFFDVEKSDGDLYLFGVVSDDAYRHFVLNLRENGWKEEWREFLKLVSSHPQAPIYHYDRFDREVLSRFGKLSGTDVRGLLDRLVDLYAVVTHSIILPVRFYSLKDVASTLGFRWRENGVNGYEAMLVLSAWERSGEETLLRKILRYNEDDCRALTVVKERLKELDEEEPTN